MRSEEDGGQNEEDGKEDISVAENVVKGGVQSSSQRSGFLLRRRTPRSGSKSGSKSSDNGGGNIWKTPHGFGLGRRDDEKHVNVTKLPKKVGDFRSLHYQVSNQWSSQCRVRSVQVVDKYDPGGGGIVVMETRQLPDIPWGRNFVVLRKLSILYIGTKQTKLTISTQLQIVQPQTGQDIISQPTWPSFVQTAIAREMLAMWYVFFSSLI